MKSYLLLTLTMCMLTTKLVLGTVKTYMPNATPPPNLECHPNPYKVDCDDSMGWMLNSTAMLNGWDVRFNPGPQPMVQAGGRSCWSIYLDGDRLPEDTESMMGVVSRDVYIGIDIDVDGDMGTIDDSHFFIVAFSVDTGGLSGMIPRADVAAWPKVHQELKTRNHAFYDLETAAFFLAPNAYTQLSPVTTSDDEANFPIAVMVYTAEDQKGLRLRVSDIVHGSSLQNNSVMEYIDYVYPNTDFMLGPSTKIYVSIGASVSGDDMYLPFAIKKIVVSNECEHPLSVLECQLNEGNAPVPLVRKQKHSFNITIPELKDDEDALCKYEKVKVQTSISQEQVQTVNLTIRRRGPVPDAAFIFDEVLLYDDPNGVCTNFDHFVCLWDSDTSLLFDCTGQPGQSPQDIRGPVRPIENLTAAFGNKDIVESIWEFEWDDRGNDLSNQEGGWLFLYCLEYTHSCQPPGPNECPPNCPMGGDPHYISLDGYHFKYDGACSYMIISNQCGGDDNDDIPVSVVAHHGRCRSRRSNIVCMKGVTITIGESVYEIDDHNMFFANGEKKGNAQEIGNIGFNDNIVHVTIKNRFHEIDQRYYQVFSIRSLQMELELEYSDYAVGTLITKKIPENMKFCGLLGNHNGDPTDDVRLRDGTLLTVDPDTIGKWEADDNIIAMADSWMIPTNHQPLRCDIYPLRSYASINECHFNKGFVEEQCDLVLKRISKMYTGRNIAKCFDMEQSYAIDMTRIYDDCVTEICSCSFDDISLCEPTIALGLLKKTCLSNGASTDFPILDFKQFSSQVSNSLIDRLNPTN